MSQYSRKEKVKSQPSATEHVKTGFTALQKTVALIGSILSIVVASLTINNALNNSKDKDKADNDTPKTTIIQKESNQTADQDKVTTNQTPAASESKEEDTTSSDTSKTADQTTTKENTTASDSPAATTTETPAASASAPDVTAASGQ